MSSWWFGAVLIFVFAVVSRSNTAQNETVTTSVPRDTGLLLDAGATGNLTNNKTDLASSLHGNSTSVEQEAQQPVQVHNGSRMMPIPEVGASRGTAKKTDVRDDVAHCYTCDSYTDANNCRQLDQLKLEKCQPNIHDCHYIVGQAIQSGVSERIVRIGCDVAPAIRIVGVPTPITHTAYNGGPKTCSDFISRHQDSGSVPEGAERIANMDVTFRGQTCTCDSSSKTGCNGDYTRLLEQYRSGAGQATISATLLLATLSYTFF